MIVLDACAGVSIVLDELEGLALQALIETDEKVITNELYGAEVANAIRRLVRLGKLSKMDAQDCYEKAISLVDEFWPMEDMNVEVLNESIRLQHSSYDLYYFVLARRTGSCLFTLDRKLMDLADKNGVDIIHEINF